MSRGTFHENDLYYKSKWKSVAEVLWKSNLRVSRIAVAGSRATRQQRLDSDMDVIFTVAGNPSTQEFHPKLISLLKSNFPLENVYPGSNNNIVHLDFKSGGKFELVLLTESEFNKEHNDDVDYRRRNL